MSASSRLFLADLEAAEVSILSYRSAATPDTVTAVARLKGLGVVLASQVNPGGVAPHIEVQPELSGSFAADDVTDAVQPEIDDEGNRHKVSAGALPGRHLFVWVDWVAGAAAAAFHSVDDPTTAPRLPPEVTCVWSAPDVIDFKGQVLRSPVWRTSGGMWERLGPRYGP